MEWRMIVLEIIYHSKYTNKNQSLLNYIIKTALMRYLPKTHMIIYVIIFNTYVISFKKPK